jgi:hypothetical protein
MSDVFDDIIARQASRGEAARIAAVIASDFRFVYFGSAAFVVRLLRLDQKLADGVPMNPRRLSNILNPSRSCCGNSAAMSPSREMRPWCYSPMAGQLKFRCFESLSQSAELNRGERTRDESPAPRC